MRSLLVICGLACGWSLGHRCFAASPRATELILARIHSVSCDLILSDGRVDFARLPIGSAVLVRPSSTEPFHLGYFEGEAGSDAVRIGLSLHVPKSLNLPTDPPLAPPAEFTLLSKKVLDFSRLDVSLPPGGTSTQAHERLNVLDQVPLRFNIGEAVRYRDRENSMREGTVVAIVGEGNLNDPVEILRDGEVDRVTQARVFKRVRSGGAHTPDLGRIWWTGLPLMRPAGLLLRLLDGIARYSSLEHFSAASPARQIFEIALLIQAFVPFHPAALTGEIHGFLDYDGYIKAGLGCCRHQGVILALALAELGFRTALVSLPKPFGQAHLWQEVTVEAGESSPTYIVDPTFASPLVMTAADMRAWMLLSPIDRVVVEQTGYLDEARVRVSCCAL